MEEKVILVDENDKVVGSMGKLEAHKNGNLHRAFSIFIFNSDKELLLQQRAHVKYHSAGLWTNTCCGHPRPDEDILKAATRRLHEETGLSVELNKIFHFKYKATLPENLIEHEIDHVFIGYTNKAPLLIKEEAEMYKYMPYAELHADVSGYPEKYTHWFKLCYKKVFENLN